MNRKHHSRRSVLLNSIPITGNMKRAVLATRRDNILEGDPVYQENARCLVERARQHKLDAGQYRNMQQWLANSAMRRAGISLVESRQLLNA